MVVTTAGRAQELAGCLDAIERSEHPVAVVAVADQSRAGDEAVGEICAAPRQVRVVRVRSHGGASRGRNDAIRAISSEVDFVAIPNDNTRIRPSTLGRAVTAFTAAEVAAVGGTLVEDGKVRYRVPHGEVDRRRVWRLIEPALMLRVSHVRLVSGFDEMLGPGSPGLWQCAEGSDLLLRLMTAGFAVVGDPKVEVDGPGARRTLTEREWLIKQRAYARGCGRVFRVHGYSLPVYARLAAAPWARWLLGLPGRGPTLREAYHVSVGRTEGLIGRPLSRRLPERLSQDALRQ